MKTSYPVTSKKEAVFSYTFDRDTEVIGYSKLVLAAHEAIEKVAVVGLPDETWGEVATAVVVPVGGRAVIGADLIVWSRERLAGFETPKRVVDSLPQTVGGKVRKHEIRAQFGG